MITLKNTIVLAGLALVTASSAFATGTHNDVSKPSDKTGVYIDAGVGTNFTAYSIDTGNGHSISDGSFSKAGANVNLGYKINNYLAPEVGYTYYGIGIQSFDAALKGILPLNVGKYGANIFGKIGVAHLYNDYASVTDPLLGIGAALGVAQNVDWNVQAQAVVDTTDNIHSTIGLLSTGLTFYIG